MAADGLVWKHSVVPEQIHKKYNMVMKTYRIKNSFENNVI